MSYEMNLWNIGILWCAALTKFSKFLFSPRQYFLENVDFSAMRTQQPRLAFGANSGVGEAAVLPVFLAKDVLTY